MEVNYARSRLREGCGRGYKQLNVVAVDAFDGLCSVCDTFYFRQTLKPRIGNFLLASFSIFESCMQQKSWVQRGILGAFGILNLFSAVTTRGSVRGSLSMVRIASVDISLLFKVTMDLITFFAAQFIVLPKKKPTYIEYWILIILFDQRYLWNAINII